MLLDKLESGFLVFETRQGLVRVELSFRQRMYLLWTFRHFRQLSVPLLNPRQRTLVNSLFRNHADVIPHLDNSLPVIGVVEEFVPPVVPIETPIEVPIRALPAPKLAQRPAQKPTPIPIKERPEPLVAQLAEIAPEPKSAPSSSPKFDLPTLAWSKLITSKLATFKLAKSKLTISRLATTIGALSLCIISVGAWHRMQVLPASQAQSQVRLQQINAISVPDSPHPAEPAPTAERSTVSLPPAATAPIAAVPEATVTPASIAADVPVHSSVHIPAPIATSSAVPKRAIRVYPAASTPQLPLAGADSGISGIQASRAPLRFAYPDYTDVRARGVVALTAGVDSEGAVRTVRVVSGNRALAAAAVQAIRHWRYRPYLKDGQPLATETNIVISYFAKDAISMSFPPSIPAIH